MVATLGGALGAHPAGAVPLQDPGFNDPANFGTNWNPQLGSPSVMSLDIGAPGNNGGVSDPTQTSARFAMTSGIPDQGGSLGIRQAVTLTPFHGYQLVFFTSNQISNATGYFAAGIFLPDGTRASQIFLNAVDSGFQQHSLTLSTGPSGSGFLLFSLASPNFTQDLTVFLDDVTLTDLGPVSAPEIDPSAATLPFAFVLAGLALVRDARRRRLAQG